jgi:ankyrin repeat protein
MFSSLFSSSGDRLRVAAERFREAAQNGNLDEVQRLYKRRGSDIVNAVNKGGETPLHCASKHGKLKAVKYLVETCGADVHAANGNGCSPLHSASLNGYLEVVKFLLETAGADIHAVTTKGDTPLHVASRNGILEIVKHLVEQCGADAHAVNKYGDTPLLSASWGGELEVVKYLVEAAGTDIHAVALNGDTPLHIACSRNRLRIVKYFVDKSGVDIHAVNNSGATPLDLALSTNNAQIAAYLKSQLELELLEEVRSGNLDQVRRLILQKCNVETKNADGQTPLHLAVVKGHVEIARYLLRIGGAKVESINRSRQTALHLTCAIGDLALVRLLVEEYGADNSALDKDGMTPLDGAMRNNKENVVKYLESRMDMESHDTINLPEKVPGNATVSTATSTPIEINMGSTGAAVPTIPNGGPYDNATLNESSLAQHEDTLQLENQRLEELLARRNDQNETGFTNAERNILAVVIGETCQTQAEEDEKQAILSSHHAEFYILLCRKLYCMISAYEVLSSGSVDCGTGRRSTTRRVLHEKTCDVIKDAEIGAFLADIIECVKKTLAVVPFLDIVGSTCQLILTLKDERDR